jgi:hypothetical protein
MRLVLNFFLMFVIGLIAEILLLNQLGSSWQLFRVRIDSFWVLVLIKRDWLRFFGTGVAWVIIEIVRKIRFNMTIGIYWLRFNALVHIKGPVYFTAFIHLNLFFVYVLYFGNEFLLDYGLNIDWRLLVIVPERWLSLLASKCVCFLF